MGTVSHVSTETKTSERTEEPLARLKRSIDFIRSQGLKKLPDEQLSELPDLYRHACSQLAKRESRGESAQSLAQLRNLAGTAHGILFRGLNRSQTSFLSRTYTMMMVRSPRAIRAEWKLLAASFLLMYGLAVAAYYAVIGDLSMAFSLLNPAVVAGEIEQLSALQPGDSFRGNFTFGLGESPQTAGMIMFHNMGVGVLFFASALIPILYILILTNNALMLGTYTAVAGHWGQAEAISSVLWCHGVIEIQTFVLAATAGLVLVRGIVAPGARTRAFALKQEAQRAWELFAPVFPLLFIAGIIEGFISPHMPFGTRISMALLTGLGLVMWVSFCGRESSESSAR